MSQEPSQPTWYLVKKKILRDSKCGPLGKASQDLSAHGRFPSPLHGGQVDM